MSRLIKFLVIILFLGCDEKRVDLELEYSLKNLHRIYYGNNYYKIKGISSKVDSIKFNLSKPEETLIIESSKKIEGFNQGVLLLDSLSFFMNEYTNVPFVKKEVKFNNYIDKTLYFSPSFSLENLELIGLRNTKILTTEDNNHLDNYFSLNEENLNLNDLTFYKRSIDDLKDLQRINLFPSSLSDLKLVQNPFTNLYSVYPDLRYFTKNQNSIIYDFINRIRTSKMNYETGKKVYKIYNDTLIDKDLYLRNKELRIYPGTHIVFKNNSSLIVDNSEVYFSGSKKDSIFIEGKDSNSILFRNCNNVEFAYTSVENLQNFYDEKIQLPSSITFYNSNVNIFNSKFKSNTRGDDLINLFYSRFHISDSFFLNSLADAIDSDFSNGEIMDSFFYNIGNDAIDFSGSNVNLKRIKLNYVKDKAISAGENSNITLDNINIFNSEIGVVVKDGSLVNSRNVSFNNNKINYCSFMKKSFYDYPILILQDSILSENNLFEKNSIVKQKHGKRIINFSEDVEDLLYGNVYGKSSK